MYGMQHVHTLIIHIDSSIHNINFGGKYQAEEEEEEEGKKLSKLIAFMLLCALRFFSSGLASRQKKSLLMTLSQFTR